MYLLVAVGPSHHTPDGYGYRATGKKLLVAICGSAATGDTDSIT